MKRNPLQRISSFLPKPKKRLEVQQLESRDVPAVFFVDPNYDGIAPSAANFSGVPLANFGLANAGNTFIGDFAGFGLAIAAAQASVGPDTIYFGNGNSVIPNALNTHVTINDNLTFVGGGVANSTLIPGNPSDPLDPFGSAVFVIDTPATSLNLQDFTYDGTSSNAAIGFYYSGVTSDIKGVNFTGYGTGLSTAPTDQGQAIWAATGSKLSVTGGTFTNVKSRSGIYVTSVAPDSTTLTVNGTTFTGSASGSGRDSYGVEVIGNSKANISNSTFNLHLGNSGGEGSSGILAYADSGSSPEVTVLRNTFTNNTVGVYVGNSAIPGDKSSALIAYNSFTTGNTLYSIQANNINNGQAVNARFNWFNSETGPSGGNSTFGLVNTSQFLRAPLGTPEPDTVSNNARFVTAPNSTAGGTPLGNNTNGTFAAPSTPTGKSYPLRDSAGVIYPETGETRVAFVDLNNDGYNEIIVSSSTSELVSIYNGAGGLWIKSFSGLTQNTTPAKFAGGVYVAGGDINGDGTRDLIVSQGAFDPRVVVYNGVTVLSGPLNRLVDFIDATNRGTFLMGVTVAAGDFNGDGYDDIVTGAIQPSASTAISSNVRVFDGKSLMSNPLAVPNANPALALNRTTDRPAPNVDYFAYGSAATGVNVAAADVNGDGRAELVSGTARLGANLRAFSFTAGSLLAPTTFVSGSSTPTLVADFLVGANNAGVRVAARDLNNDGYADILWTLGTGAPPVGVIDGKSLTLTGPTSGITPPGAPVGYTLLTAAYTASSKGAWVA